MTHFIKLDNGNYITTNSDNIHHVSVAKFVSNSSNNETIDVSYYFKKLTGLTFNIARQNPEVVYAFLLHMGQHVHNDYDIYLEFHGKKHKQILRIRDGISYPISEQKRRCWFW